MRQYLVCAAIALSGACSKEAPPAAQTQSAPTAAPTAPAAGAATLGAEGIGAIRFGMTLPQAEQAAGAKAILPQPFDPACSMVRFPSLPGLRFMVEQGVVTRADADAGIANTVGVAVGDTLAQVRAGHPAAEVTPHKYDENGHYISFPGADGRSAIILEETGGKVGKIRAGLQPAVAYVETCG